MFYKVVIIELMNSKPLRITHNELLLIFNYIFNSLCNCDIQFDMVPQRDNLNKG